jgi:UDP-GlcNAc:undecaprenyl-phosphate/decaprenyl-phosphate GlcNAc-1-phosphate transferase
MRSYLSAFVLAMLFAFLLTPPAMRLAGRLGALDRTQVPALPRIGGLAIVAGALFALLGLSLVFEPTRNLLKLGWLELGAGAIAAIGIVALGLVDDVKGLGAGVKFGIEILIAAGLWFAGVQIKTLWLPLGVVGLGPAVGFVFTIVWIVGITNAFNLLDGIDGAAAGAAVFALIAMFVTSVTLDRPLVALLTVTLAGATLGFLPFNFPPARVYLGDVGSLTLGFALAVLAIEGAAKGPAIVALAIPMVAFAVPVLDTAIAVARRALRGAPVFKGDREHLHHRLLDLGLTKPQAAVILYAVCAAFALASMLFLNPNVRGMAVVMTMVGLVVWLAVRYLRLHEFYELARLASRGIQQTRAIQFNVSLRRAAEALNAAQTWDQIVKVLAELFAASEFDSVRLTVQRPGNVRLEYRLEGGEVREATEAIQADEWGVHLPFQFGADGATSGEIAAFRRYGRRPLLTDVNLIVEALRPALVKAAGRVTPPALRPSRPHTAPAPSAVPPA